MIEADNPFIPDTATGKVVQIGWSGGELLVFDKWRRTIESYPNSYSHGLLVAVSEERFLDVLLVLVRYDWLRFFSRSGIIVPRQPNFDDNETFIELYLAELESAGGCEGARLFFSRSW